jgi:PBP1b-binding outer membrane lipoprotein LpoB
MKYAALFLLAIVGALLLAGCTQQSPSSPQDQNQQSQYQSPLAQSDLVSDTEVASLDSALSGTDSGLDDLNSLSDVQMESVSQNDFD